MGTHTIHRPGVTTRRVEPASGRLLFTVVGGAALIVAAFLNWTRGMTGDDLSNHALVKTEFLVQSDVVRTVGGISVVIGLVAMVGLLDRSGWLTRLAGLLGLALFVMFAIEVYRSDQHTMQAGAWLALGGSIVLLVGGFMHGRRQVEREPVYEEQEPLEPPPAV